LALDWRDKEQKKRISPRGEQVRRSHMKKGKSSAFVDWDTEVITAKFRYGKWLTSSPVDGRLDGCAKF
jgi:hypothetical protein